ncbi:MULTISPECIES: SpoIID/LytB domain-containing protein [Bacillaceae]|nr:SpoIID/LytB domain-containing protein [Mesobacillus boroniphilus]
MLFSLAPRMIEAAEPVQYPNEVQVSVLLSSNFPMLLDGTYELHNIDNNSKTVIPQNTNLSVKSDSTGITVSYPGFSKKAKNGFNLRELKGSKKLAIFNSTTEMRRGASTSYEVVKTFKSGESADYNFSFTNGSGELWYNVTSGSSTGWILSKTATLSEVPSLAIAKVNNNLSYRGSFYLDPNGSQVQLINKLDMEDYLKGVVPSEMPASWNMEALKAQAIAARSYAANMMMLTSTAASQVYRGYTAETTRTNTAIKETTGLMVKYNGKPIQAFFHSTSGGKTANVGDVWNSDQSYFPYLVSVPDPYEKAPLSNWSETFAASTIVQKFGFSSNAQLLNITLDKKGVNGEVRGVTVQTSEGTKTITGNENVIRKLFPLNNSSVYNMLYSNWFDIADLSKSGGSVSVQTSSGSMTLDDLKGQTVQTSSGRITLSDSKVSIQTSNGIITNEGSGISSITLEGKGWGHRIGMSQYGAKGFAENGYTATQIITHYFKGTTVSK